MDRRHIQDALLAIVGESETPTTTSVLEVFLARHIEVLQTDARGALLELISVGIVRVGASWRLALTSSDDLDRVDDREVLWTTLGRPLTSKSADEPYGSRYDVENVSKLAEYLAGKTDAELLEFGKELQSDAMKAMKSGVEDLVALSGFVLEEITSRLHNVRQIERTLEEARSENAKLRAWVDDLQSGMYVNCVYCGHCYGPHDAVPKTMADMLKDHVEQCPAHPLAMARARIVELERAASGSG